MKILKVSKYFGTEFELPANGQVLFLNDTCFDILRFRVGSEAYTMSIGGEIFWSPDPSEKDKYFDCCQKQAKARFILIHSVSPHTEHHEITI